MLILFNLFPQNMTPLTVAAYLARMEMFFHIANIEREVYWQIGKCMFPHTFSLSWKKKLPMF